MATKTAPVERERRVDHLGFLRQTVHELSGYDALAYELIQNADDAKGADSLRFDVRQGALLVEDDGGFTDCMHQDADPEDCAFLNEGPHMCDFHSLRSVAGGDKQARDDTTGAFGIGFTAIYQVTDAPEVLS